MENSTTTSPLSKIGFGQIVPALNVFLGGAIHRGELAALELSELSHHAFLVLMSALIATVLVLLGGFAVTFTIASIVWDMPERTAILGAIALAYLLGGGLTIYLAAVRIKKWRPFPETRRQLRSDHQCLQSLLAPEQPSHENGHSGK